MAETKNVSQNELKRQFRVMDQMITMHSVLAFRFSRLALILDISLLVSSVIFCATTFVSDELFLGIGLTPKNVRLILGLASVLAFIAAIISLRVDWKGNEARHREAVQKLASTLALFRETRLGSGLWPRAKVGQLNDLYWDTMNGVVGIPNHLFPSLKSRHLRKVELSKLIDTHFGTPTPILRIIVFGRGLRTLIQERRK